jgi:transcriptional regulator with XRE-family HTH domain
MNLRQIRQGRRLTQDHLGALTGIDHSRISRLENGFGRPTERERRELARVLQVPGPILFGPEEEAK